MTVLVGDEKTFLILPQDLKPLFTYPGPSLPSH